MGSKLSEIDVFPIPSTFSTMVVLIFILKNEQTAIDYAHLLSIILFIENIFKEWKLLIFFLFQASQMKNIEQIIILSFSGFRKRTVL